MKTSVDFLNQRVHVVIDRALGSAHPKHPDLVYEVNYGYVPGTRSGDGEAGVHCDARARTLPVRAGGPKSASAGRARAEEADVEASGKCRVLKTA